MSAKKKARGTAAKRTRVKGKTAARAIKTRVAVDRRPAGGTTKPSRRALAAEKRTKKYIPAATRKALDKGLIGGRSPTARAGFYATASKRDQGRRTRQILATARLTDSGAKRSKKASRKLQVASATGQGGNK